jgi:hypothetical protein
MNWQDILADAYGRLPEYLESIVTGLNQEDLSWRPREDCNSIAWLCWHLTRQQDAQIADLMGEEQLWIKDGWHEKFNRPADPRDMGFGHTPEQVAALEVLEGGTLLDYNKVVVERTIDYLKTLSEADLDRELGGPWQPPPTVGVRLVSILEDATIHAGQAAYIKGMRLGKGWQKY